MAQRMYCPKCKKFVKAYKSKGKLYCEECSEETITEFEKDNPELAKLMKNLKAILLVVFVGLFIYWYNNVQKESNQLRSLTRQRETLYCETHRTQCDDYDVKKLEWDLCVKMRTDLGKESVFKAFDKCGDSPTHPSALDENFIKAHSNLFPRDSYGSIKK